MYTMYLKPKRNILKQKANIKSAVIDYNVLCPVTICLYIKNILHQFNLCLNYRKNWTLVTTN